MPATPTAPILLASLLVFGFAAAMLSAQERADREFMDGMGPMSRSWVLIRGHRDPGKPYWIEVQIDDCVRGVIEPAMDWLGDYHIDRARHQLWLAGSRKAEGGWTDGVVSTYLWTEEGHLIHMNTRVDPGARYLGIAVDHARENCYLLDDAARRVRRISLKQGDASPLQTLLKYEDFTRKESLGRYELRISQPDTHPILTLAGHSFGCFFDASLRYEIHLEGEKPRVEKISMSHRFSYLAQAAHECTAGRKTLDVRLSRVDDAMDLVEQPRVRLIDLELEKTLGEANVDAGGKGRLHLDEPLELGRVYALLTNIPGDDDCPNKYVGIKNWGRVDPLPWGYRMRPIGEYITCDSCLGVNLSSRLDVDAENAERPFPECEAHLLIGTEDQVRIRGELVFLDAELEYPTRLLRPPMRSGEDKIGFFLASVPDDPALDGMLVCYQWLIFLSPDDIRASNILGAIIRTTRAFDPERGATTRDPAANRFHPWTPRSKEVFERWLLGSEVRRLDAKERERWKERVLHRR